MSTQIKNNRVIIGINWGAIEEEGWFGATQLTGIDLDMCCFLLDNNQKHMATLNWEKKEQPWGAISKDNMEGDMNGDDQQDNEYITINLNHISPNNELFITVSNYSERSIQNLSHFDYRIYSGEPNKVQDLFYYKNMKEVPIDNNTKGILLGSIKKNKGEWQFQNKESLMEVCDALPQLEYILSERLIPAE